MKRMFFIHNSKVPFFAVQINLFGINFNRVFLTHLYFEILCTNPLMPTKVSARRYRWFHANSKNFCNHGPSHSLFWDHGSKKFWFHVELSITIILFMSMFGRMSNAHKRIVFFWKDRPPILFQHDSWSDFSRRQNFAIQIWKSLKKKKKGCTKYAIVSHVAENCCFFQFKMTFLYETN